MEPVIVTERDDNTGTACSHRLTPENVMIDSDCPIARAIRYRAFCAEGSSQKGNNVFNSNNYWSATENNATNAWYVNFNNGNTNNNNNNKTNNNRVRCVR